MKEYQKSIVPHIESLYDNFTPSEKTIADFFIHNTEEIDISSKHLSHYLIYSSNSVCKSYYTANHNNYSEFSAKQQ